MYDPDKRRAEIAELLEVFIIKSKEKGDQYTLLDNPVERIVQAYEMLLTSTLKLAHVDETNLNIYKVASGLEMAVNYVRPILTEDVFMFEALNAHFAVTVAFSYVFSKKMTNADIELNISENDILKDHHEVLVYANVETIFGSALFTNGLFWRAFYLCVFQRLDLEATLSKQ